MFEYIEEPFLVKTGGAFLLELKIVYFVYIERIYYCNSGNRLEVTV